MATGSNRRDVLKTGGAAITVGLTGLAGCVGGGGGSDTGAGNKGTKGTKTGSAGSGDAVSLNLGHGVAAEETLWLMSAKSDILEHWGEVYEATFRNFSSSAARFQAFQAGEIQAGTAPVIKSIFGVEKGLGLTIVASIAKETKESFSTPFMITQDAGITNSKDLEGKTIGVNGFKTATSMWARMALKKGGLDPERGAKLAKVPFPSMGSAIAKGRISTGPLPHPFDATAKKEHGLETVFTGVDILGFGYDLLELWFSKKFLANQEETAKAFLEDYAKAIDYYNSNTKDAKRAIHKAGFVKTPLDVYLGLDDWKRGTRPETKALKRFNKIAVELGWLDSKVSINQLYDLSYLPRNK